MELLLSSAITLMILSKFRSFLGYLLYHCATEPEKWECNKCKLTVPNTMVESLLSILKSVVILFHVYLYHLLPKNLFPCSRKKYGNFCQAICVSILELTEKEEKTKNYQRMYRKYIYIIISL